PRARAVGVWAGAAPPRLSAVGGPSALPIWSFQPEPVIGAMTDRPAARTPGAAAIAAPRRQRRSRRPAGSETTAGRLTFATVSPPAPKPSGVAFSAANVRRNKPAPT